VGPQPKPYFNGDRDGSIDVALVADAHQLVMSTHL
jgi:hypothetical protein